MDNLSSPALETGYQSMQEWLWWLR